MGRITSSGAAGAKREAQIAEGKSCDRNLSFLIFHVSSSNGPGAANIGCQTQISPLQAPNPACCSSARCSWTPSPNQGDSRPHFPELCHLGSPNNSKVQTKLKKKKRQKKEKKVLSPFFQFFSTFCLLFSTFLHFSQFPQPTKLKHLSHGPGFSLHKPLGISPGFN